MEAIIWIAVTVYVLWRLFRFLSNISKRPPGGASPQPELKDTTGSEIATVPGTKPISKKERWKNRPDDIFKKEYVSFTRLKTFKTCPRMFELIYLYGFEDKSGRAAQVGNLVHKMVHLYTAHHKNRMSDELRNLRAAEKVLEFYHQAVSSTELTYRIPKSELEPLIRNFVFLNRKDNFQVQSTEHECDSVIAGYKLKCIIDRIDEGPTLIDYKTGNPGNVVDNQLNVYAYAVSNGRWAPSQLVFQFLKTREVRDWKYTTELHHATEKWLLDKIREIENTTVFQRNRSQLCKYCNVSGYCYGVPQEK